MRQPFDAIHLIYNPKSTTHKAQRIAEDLKDQLKQNGFRKITVHETKHRGHATEIAYEAASRSKTPLIISVSGDGGYNEVINGIMRAVAEGKAGQPYCAVEAAGNANDHYHVMRKSGTLLQALKSNHVRTMDVLSFEAESKEHLIHRYAHSYVGFGVTPQIVEELNKHDLTRLRETFYVWKTFMTMKPFSIRKDNGQEALYDSIIFSNIWRMAKFFKVAPHTKPNDGSFEVMAHKHRARTLLAYSLFKVLLWGPKHPQKVTHYECFLPKPMVVQFDGEVIQIPKESVVTVVCKHNALRTF